MENLIESLSPVLLFLERVILFLLLGLGAGSLTIFVFRLRSYRAALGDPAKWMGLLTKDLASRAAPAVTLSAEDEKTVTGRVVKTGMVNLGLSPEALEKVFDVQESAEKRELDRGLSFLATVGANAPFLGLTGTVIGILVAFDRFAATGGRGGSEVMVSISRALIATAVGLIVAIPAVVFYNTLRNRMKIILDQAREIRGLILARSLHAVSDKEA